MQTYLVALIDGTLFSVLAFDVADATRQAERRAAMSVSSVTAVPARPIERHWRTYLDPRD